MKHGVTIRSKVTLIVLIVMISSGILTGLAFLALMRLGLISTTFRLTVWMPIVIIAVSSVLGTVFAALAVRLFIKPLDSLVKATQSIAKGDFSVRVDEQNRFGELSTLLKNFNIMTKELEGTEMFRSDFINNFSHEFKTPIVSIRGFARQLENENITEEQRKQYTEIIVSEWERLATMSSNVLLLTKLEHQQVVGERKAYSLDEQLRRSVLLFEKDWERKNIELDIDLEEIIYVGNEELMSHVWINLLANAIKFTPDGGKISVRALKKGNEISVRISDTGVGMTHDVMEHIFDKFYQGDKSHAGSGNGLGLSLVRRIAELCDGRIVVDSEVGAGSAFTVFLPV